jgi:hypothetical protein
MRSIGATAHQKTAYSLTQTPPLPARSVRLLHRKENPSFCFFYQSSTQTKTLALTLKTFFAYHGSAKVANSNRSRLVFCENLQITICIQLLQHCCCCSSSSSSSSGHLSSIWSLLQVENLGKKSNAVVRFLAQQQHYKEQW